MGSTNRFSGIVFGAVIVLVFARISYALYSSSDAVVQLQDDNFADAVIKYDGVAMVEFFAPWCGHCKALSPHYKKVADKMKGIALVASVDCDNPKTKKICRQHGIQSFPTIKIFPADKQKNPYTGELGKQPEDYQGPRTAKPMLQALEAHISDIHITKIASSADLDAFKAKQAEHSKVLLYTNKDKPALLYKGLSTAYRNRLAFGLVHESASELVEAAGVKEFPSLHVIKADGELVVYDQEMKAESVKQFLETFAAPDSAADSGSKSEEPLPLPAITNLTAADLEDIDAKEDMWLIAFYAASALECTPSLIAHYLEAVRDLHGMVNTALVKVSPEDLPKLPQAYGLDTAAFTWPCSHLQVVFFPYGEQKRDRGDYAVYKGGIYGKALQKWVMERVPDFTTEVTSGTYMQFLGGAQGAPVFDGIRVMLYTNKPEAPPALRALAAAFQKRARYLFGFMNVNMDEANLPWQVVEVVKTAKLPTLALVLPVTEEGQTQVVNVVHKHHTGELTFPAMYQSLGGLARQLTLLTTDDASSSTASAEDISRGQPDLHICSNDEQPLDPVDPAPVASIAT